MKHRSRAAIVAALTLALALGTLPAWAEEGAERPDGQARIGGKVTSVAGATFTVKTPRRGEVKVQTDSSTEWIKGSADDVKAGTAIVAAGTLTGSVLHADKVGITQERPARKARRMAKRGLRGEVVSVQGNKFTLKTPKGELTVHTSEQTRFVGIEEDELSKGDRVGVIPDCGGAGPAGKDEQARQGDHRGERLAPREFAQKARPGDAVAKGRRGADRLKACIKGAAASRSVKARAVVSVPERSLRQDALAPGEAGLSA